jgi:hypothetical protein
MRASQIAQLEENMSFLLSTHSHLRWLILFVALIAAIKFAIGWWRGGAFQRIDRMFSPALSGLMDLQALLGLVLLVWGGVAGAGFPPFRIEHAVTMVVAAAVAHLHVLWKNAEDKKRFRNSFFIILDTVIIIFFGVARLPGGWTR